MTRAARAFGPNELSQLPANDLRQLVHAFLLAEGITVEGFRSLADYDELTVRYVGLWRTRPSPVRIMHRPATPADVDNLSETAQQLGSSHALLMVPHGTDEPLEDTALVTVVSDAELTDRIIASPLTRWEDDQPSAAADRLELLLDLEQTTSLLDPVGIRWLPSLALNEQPPGLADLDVEPQDLLERKAFRLLTASFLFNGVRYGEASRGERVPDAVLHMPDGSQISLLVDCKAASEGYRMAADHLLRFQEYWDKLQPPLNADGYDLRYLLVLSSHFPGVDGDAHPFYRRAEQVRDRTGLELVYVTASDLAWTAAALEAADVPLAERRSLDWTTLLAAGRPSENEFRTLIEGVA